MASYTNTTALIHVRRRMSLILNIHMINTAACTRLQVLLVKQTDHCSPALCAHSDTGKGCGRRIKILIERGQGWTAGSC